MIDERIARMMALEPLQAGGDQRRYFRATYQAPGQVLLKLAAAGFGVRLPG